MNRNSIFTLILATLTLVLLAGCSPPSSDVSIPEAQTPANEPVSKASITETGFGTTSQGIDVSKYTLMNDSGMTADITNYGGIVLTLTAPDRNGVFEDVVLGYETLAEYEAETPYFGALIGRYGNRIAFGRFELDGEEYTLATNNDPNHLHGGILGYDKVVWDAQASETPDGPSLLLSYVSVDGEEGYPGTLSVEVRYTLTHDNQLAIEYTASTDKATPVNLTSHSYFNLTGDTKRDILGHKLQIAAEYFTPVDSTLIPNGEYRPVEGTPFDFRTPTTIGDGVNADDEQIVFGGGYDHNWVIDQDADGEFRYIATLSEPDSGRVMKIHSNEPGLQFYSGNFLDGSLTGKGVVYEHRYGMCLETQHFPDSPNQPGFPSTILRPGETYHTRTTYTFSTGGTG